jgi:hypothetical protein
MVDAGQPHKVTADFLSPTLVKPTLWVAEFSLVFAIVERLNL